MLCFLLAHLSLIFQTFFCNYCYLTKTTNSFLIWKRWKFLELLTVHTVYVFHESLLNFLKIQNFREIEIIIKIQFHEKITIISSFLFEVLSSQHGNYWTLVTLAEISWKATLLLNKLLKIWFDEIFFGTYVRLNCAFIHLKKNFVNSILLQN